MERSLLLPFVALLALASQAQPLFKMIPIPDEAVPYASGTVRASDGGFIIQLNLDSAADVVWRCDVNGEPLWCKTFDPDVFGMVAMPDGGFVFPGGISIDMWTSVYEHELVRVDADGNIVWSEMITGTNAMFYLSSSASTNKPLITSDGIIYFFQEDPLLVVEKFAFDGTPLWARAVEISGATVSMDIEATVGPNDQVSLFCSEYDDPWWQVITFEADGDMLWNKRYRLTNGYWTMSISTGISSFLGGDILISGHLRNLNLNEDQDFLARLDPLGQVRWMNFYESTLGVNGDMLTDENGMIYIDGEKVVLDSNGTQLSRLEASLPTVLQNDTMYQYFTGSPVFDMASHERWEAGRYRKQDQIFGVLRSTPVIIRSPWDWGDGCFDVDLLPTVEPLAVPASVQQIEDGDTAIVVTLSSAAIPWSSEDATLYQPVDQCSAVAVSTTPAQEEPLLLSNAITSGTDLQIRTSAPIHVEVFDMTGKLVARNRLNGPGNISTRTWPSGAYVVQASSLNGSNIRTARVVVF